MISFSSNQSGNKYCIICIIGIILGVIFWIKCRDWYLLDSNFFSDGCTKECVENINNSESKICNDEQKENACLKANLMKIT